MKNTFPLLKNLSVLSPFLLSSLFLTACGGSSENNTPNDKVISGKLLPPPDGQVYFGSFTNFGAQEDEVSIEKIETFDDLTGKPSAWSYFSNNWMYNDANGNHKAEIRYPHYNIHQVVEAGKTPFVRLMPWTSPHILGNPTTKARQTENALNLTSVCTESQTFSHNETRLIAKSELQEFINNGATEGVCMDDFSMQSIIDGDWDDDLRAWANEAKEDRDDNGDIIPLLVTFTVEMEGSWFPWCGIYNGGAENNYKPQDGLADGPERFRDAYRHIIDLFREVGANNVTWFYSPNIIRPQESWMKFYTQDWNHPKNYYPGDDYIDWLGTTIYGPSNEISTDVNLFSSRVSQKFHLINEISENKPLALLEFGAFENNKTPGKPAWYRDMIKTVLNQDYIKFDAIAYWNDNFDEKSGNVNHNLEVDSSEESLTTFRELISNPRFISELHFSP